MDIITSGYFFWIVGIVFSQIYFLIDAPFFKEKRLYAFLYGIINLIILSLGAKLLYIFENLNFVIHYGLTFSGFSLFGAIFFLPLSAFIVSLIFKKDYFNVASFITIASLIMLGFYRVDCWISGCCGGIMINGFKIPTQIIESVSCLLMATLFIFFTHYKKLYQGQCFYLFFLIYGLLRFIIEFFRVRTNLFSVFSISHIFALISIIIGIILMILTRRFYAKTKQ